MLTTPQTPINEQQARQEQAQQAQQPIQQPIQQPNAWRPAPPMGAYMAPAPTAQAMFLQPTGGQRLGLAIASLALLIPLLAIAIGVMTTLMPYVAAGIAITVGLIAVALVCLVVIAVNVLFNWDLLRQQR